MNTVKNSEILNEILKFAKTFRRKFAKLLNLERCKRMIFLYIPVDFEKRCKMSVWLQKSASIQPRYRPYKLAKICEIYCKIGVRYGIVS